MRFHKPWAASLQGWREYDFGRIDSVAAGRLKTLKRLCGLCTLGGFKRPWRNVALAWHRKRE